MPIDMGTAIQLGQQAENQIMGRVQMFAGLFGAKKAEKKLNKLIDNAPKYTQNQSIMDYYNKALQRYNVSPTDSLLYKNAMQNIGRSQAAGLNSLQDRRSALAGIGSIQRASNDAMLNAGAAAENQRNQRFGVLGGATNMKVSEDDKAFQQNVLTPYEMKYNLLSQKLGAKNQLFNTGLSNMSGANQAAGMAAMSGNYGGGSNGGFYGTRYGSLYRG